MAQQQVPDADAAADAAVAADAVSRSYTRGGGGMFGGDAPTVHALTDVTMTVNSGEVVGIAGPSGSGKSTLLHLLAGLDVPTDGTITLAGEDIASLSGRQRAQLRLDNVGIVFQRFHLLNALSARANVALPLVELGYSKGRRRERAEMLLADVGLDGRLTHKPGQLSGGEQQRVAIARALASEPSLVIADEPTGELDSETGERVLDLLVDIADEQAVVLASHDQQALDVCDRVVHLRDGAVERVV
jgi:putative ABC transport system ATP-binding protein